MAHIGRVRLLACLVAALLIAVTTTAVANAGMTTVLERPVTFTIRNVNRSNVPCPTDGRTYRITARLYRPASDSPARAVTVLSHGGGNGRAWDFDAVPGYNTGRALAEQGHTVIVLDHLGYGGSDVPHGFQVCVGSLADELHQVLTALRAGGYDAGDDAPARFDRVAVVGHSGGALYAEIAATSFRSIDALGIIGWADGAAGPKAARAVWGLFGNFALTCADGGDQQRPGSPRGWYYTFKDAMDLVFEPSTDPAVIAAFHAAFEHEPCGVGPSLPIALAVNHLSLPTIDVPVLLAYGEHDLVDPPSRQAHRAHFISSPAVTFRTIEGSTHMLMLEPSAPAFRDILHDWLATNGF